MLKRALLAATLCLSLPCLIHGAPPQDVQAYLDAWIAASGVPGAQLAIVTKNGAVASYVSGESDREAHRRMTDRDLMLAGSTGKTFFAAVALQLIDAGTLDLDAKISTYLGKRPWFARLPNAADVTVRQLMTHTSGIIRYEFDDRFTKDLRANPSKVWTPEDELAYLFDTRAPFAAGAGWEYSDTNYIVLGLIVEQITGAKYYDLIDQRLLKPLKLESGAVPSTSRRIAGLAQGYAGTNDPLGLGGPVMKYADTGGSGDGEFVVNPQFEWAGGGFATNAATLARWGHELYAPDGTAISAAARALMIKAAVPAGLGPGSQYGLGVIIRPPAAAAGLTSVTWGHSGFFPGYLSELLYVVDTGMTLAIQVNSSAPRTRGTASPLRVLYDAARLATPAGVVR